MTAGEIVIGKTAFVKAAPQAKTGPALRNADSIAAEKTKRCISTIYQGNKGVVHRTLLTTNLHGEEVAKVVTRQLRIPEKGDKFTSFHAQKRTIARLIPVADMPYSLVDGTPVDIIINQVAYLARRTLGEIREVFMAKGVALDPTLAKRLGLDDATAFGRDRLRDEQLMGDILLAHGFQRTGKEILACGITGRAINADCLVGIVSQQKLTHMIDDKYYAVFTV